MKAQNKVNIKAGYELNINSPKQMKVFLYEEMHFPIQLGKTGKETTDANAIKNLFKKYPQEKILQTLLEYREKAKLVSTYLKARTDSDGIFRTSYNASGTDTGRISSSKTFNKTGGNLQNIPQSLRTLFIARSQCSFIKGDLSQAETRVVSELLRSVGDTTLAKKYQNPLFDIHKWAAGDIYDISEAKVTKEQRDVGKLSNHSGNYRAGPRVLVHEAVKRGIPGITYEFSKRILNSRCKQIPGLRKYWRGIEKELNATRVLTTCFGRKRIFFGRLESETYRRGYAYKPQSTIADLMNKIFYLCDEVLDDDCRAVLHVHDEIVINVPNHKVEIVAILLQKIAQIPLWIFDTPIFIPIEISIGENWKEMISLEDWRKTHV